MIELLHTSLDPHWNMAFEEYVLEGLRMEEPVFYLWQNSPAVIIGLNQSAYAEVNLPYLEANGIVLARRVTGGGAVYHDLGNLNYSIVGPSKEVEKHYDTVASALRSMGVPAVRSGRNDIMVDGLKCSGYAKRLSKDRMMIHGTLMWDVDLSVLTEALSVPGSKLSAAGIASVRSRVCNLRERLPQFGSISDFRTALGKLLSGNSPSFALTSEQEAEVTELSLKKFSTWEWNIGHSPATSFERSRKFSCGTVTARYTLKRGVFTELEFRGDFIGERPASELASALMGHRPEDLLSMEVSGFFDGVSAAQLFSLFS